MRLGTRAIALTLSAATLLALTGVAVTGAQAAESPTATVADAVPADAPIPAVAALAGPADLPIVAELPFLDPLVSGAPLTAAQKAELLLLTSARVARLEAARAFALRVQKTRERIVSVAKAQIGDRYAAGMSGPNAFDCSGFTRYVYKKVTGRDLPHYSRAQYTRVKKIPLRLAKPGDLVFFLRGGAHHVGIYLGKGRMVDAAGYGKGVRISPISGSWWSRTFTGIGRILPA